jgi:hypothetical protein
MRKTCWNGDLLHTSDARIMAYFGATSNLSLTGSVLARAHLLDAAGESDA